MIVPCLISFLAGVLAMFIVYYAFLRQKPQPEEPVLNYEHQNVAENRKTLVRFADGELQEIIVRETNAEGNVEKELTLDAQLNGQMKFFYPTGQLNKEKAIQGMVAEGKATTYYPNGAVYIEDEYRNGSLYKPSVAYDENGNKMKN